MSPYRGFPTRMVYLYYISCWLGTLDIFLTFCIYTIPLGRYTLLIHLLTVPHFSLSALDPLSGTPYHYPSGKHSVSQLLKRNLRPIYFILMCAEVQKCMLASVCIIQEVCVCVCVCVCACIPPSLLPSFPPSLPPSFPPSLPPLSLSLSVNVLVCMCTHAGMCVCTCEENCV